MNGVFAFKETWWELAEWLKLQLCGRRDCAMVNKDTILPA